MKFTLRNLPTRSSTSIHWILYMAGEIENVGIFKWQQFHYDQNSRDTKYYSGEARKVEGQRFDGPRGLKIF